MKRISFYLMAIVIVMGLLLGACAPAAPAATPAAPAQTTTAAAATTAAATTSAAAKTSAAATTPAQAATSAAAAQPGKVQEWKFTSFGPPGFRTNEYAKQMIKGIEEASKGAIKITLYEATLGTQTDTWDMLKSNTIQLTLTGPQGNPGRMPVSTEMGLPTVAWPDLDVMAKVYQEWTKAGYLKEVTDSFKVASFIPTPVFSLFLRDKKVEKMEDLKGLKIRAGSSMHADYLQAMGASSVSMSSGEVYMSLDRRVVDGTLTGSDTVIDRKLFEVTKYALNEPIQGDSLVILMNKETWNGLSPELQAACDKVFADVTAAAVKGQTKTSEDAWAEIGKHSEVYKISADESKRWRTPAQALTEKYIKEQAAKGYPAQAAYDLMIKTLSEYKK